MEMRSCSRWTSSPSARSSVITPESWPVVTAVWWLDSRSKVSPECGSARRSVMGRPSSTSSTTSRRLARSAATKAGISGSPSAGRVRVSEQDRQSVPLVATTQLQPAVSRFVHMPRDESPATMPSRSTTTKSSTSRSNPTPFEQDRQTEFSNASRWPQ